MSDETSEFKEPFLRQGYNPETIFYFGESVPLPEYCWKDSGDNCETAKPMTFWLKPL